LTDRRETTTSLNGPYSPKNIMINSGRTAIKPTIVLVHGLWLTPRSWEGWIDRYQKAGYNVLAPSWPGLEGDVEAVRKDPSPLKGLKLKTVVDHYEHIIRKLDAPPIIMGHSFGGLIVQMLVDRGLGSAIVRAIGHRSSSSLAPRITSLPPGSTRPTCTST